MYETETTSVEYAIQKGHHMVTYPAMIIMFATILLSIYTGVYLVPSVLIVGIGTTLSFFFAWLYWRTVITKWQLWAFQNVRNVHELKKTAIDEYLLWSDHSLLKDSDRYTPSQKEALAQLQHKFEVEDIFIDDITILQETPIYFSRHKLGIYLLGYFIFLALFLFLTFYPPWYWFGIYVIFFIFLIELNYRKYSNSEVQITISDKGIETATTQFYSWKDIKNANLIKIGKVRFYFLFYQHPNGNELIKLANYEYSGKQIKKILKIHQGRFNQIK
jgi:hypothetical protein